MGRFATKSASPHAHVVQFYDREADLVEGVGEYIADALKSVGTVLIVATPGHRAALTEWLGENGVDTLAPVDEGRYIAVDAQALLDEFMVDDRPDRERFRSVINRYLDPASAPVFAFGEMVALLWERGNVIAALELEDLWNALGEERPFSLYCAYRSASFANCDDLEAAGLVCASHSSVVAPVSYSLTELPGFEPAEQAQMFLPVAEAIGGVRRFVEGVLALNYPDALVAEAVLVASELATNAVRYAGSPFRTVIVPGEGHVRIEFHDACPATPRRQLASTSDVGGRGLAIVEHLARKWGVDEHAGRKVVWADIG